jgi:hypothetical protein
VTVTFTVAPGSGLLNVNVNQQKPGVTTFNTTTDAAGLASVESWTLGTTAGNNTLRVTSIGPNGTALSGSPQTFTATATPDVLRATISNDGITIENPSDSCIFLTPHSLERVANDINEKDDSWLWKVLYNNIELRFGKDFPKSQISPCVTRGVSLRLAATFMPRIPIRAQNGAQIMANQILPNSVKSRVRFQRSDKPELFDVELNGTVDAKARFVGETASAACNPGNPADPNCSPILDRSKNLIRFFV